MPSPARAGRPLTFTLAPGAETHARAALHEGHLRANADNTDNAAVANARCERCHDDIAAEWRASLHSRAHTEPAYARAFEREPLPFCQGCHAPEADPERAVPPDLAAVSVGCVSCHVTGDAVLAAHREPSSANPSPSPNLKRPHPVARDARFASPAACAGCHEFAFPSTGGRPRKELMQLTASEHRGSPYASFACADCHMPRVDGPKGPHRSHLFPASRDPDVLRSAASIKAERTSPTSVRVTLTAGEIGHAFPTGDLFRRLRIEIEATGDDYAVLTSDERILARRFGEQRIGLASARTQIDDDRAFLDNPTRAVDLTLGPEASDLPIHYRVLYERVEHPTSRDGTRAAIEDEGSIVLAQGTLSPVDAMPQTHKNAHFIGALRAER
jgi:hypothetical protein